MKLASLDRRTLVWTLGALAALPVGAARAGAKGILLLAHGQMTMEGGPQNMPMAEPLWNQNVQAVARELNKSIPTEIAFGMAEPPAIQSAVDRLEARGVTDIIAVPLFISSHSPIIGNFRYILGLAPHLAATTRVTRLDRIRHRAKITMAPAMDADPIISDILLERARASSRRAASATTVVLIAHGPNDDAENQLWLRDLNGHADYLKAHGGFRQVSSMTRRDDTDPAVKARALMEFRSLVKTASRTGQVIVVPVLLSDGGIEDELKDDLHGLRFDFARALLPDPRIALWVRKQVV